MSGQRGLRLGCAAVFAVAITGGITGRSVSAQAFSTEAARSASQASPELVAALSNEIGATLAAAAAFSKTGLKPELVAKAVPVLTTFVTKSGGAGVGGLLAGVLK